jgi:hypothetical protein
MFMSIMLIEEDVLQFFLQHSLEGVIIADKKHYLKECNAFLVTCNKTM